MRLDSYYPRFRRYAFVVASLGQILIILLSYGITVLLSSYIPTIEAYALLTHLAILLILQLVGLALLIRFISEPTKLIVEAITHVSHQASSVTPPRINEPRHEKSGLKTVIQTIYSLALESEHLTPERSLGKATDFAQNLLSTLPCGVMTLDSDRHVTYANQLAPVRADSSDTQVMQLEFDEKDSLQTWLHECEQSKVKAERTWSRIADKLPGESNRRIFDVVAYYQKGGAVGETIILTIDRTTAYTPEQDDMDFIAMAAHELRGPITVIRGYIDVLQQETEEATPAEKQVLLERLHVSANRLNSYVSNILNVSRYDRRHLQLRLREEHLRDVFAAITDDLNLRAHSQNRLLSITLPPDLPTVAADHASLGEVIVNLTDNAIKYSREGGQVLVTAVVKGNFVEVSVQDNGIGIPSSVMTHLFSKFYRSHRSRQSVSGTGLGLYLSKAIIESHGGNIWARSTEGEGSTFGFSVPVYATVADRIRSSNEAIIESGTGWIKNHSMFRG